MKKYLLQRIECEMLLLTKKNKLELEWWRKFRDIVKYSKEDALIFHRKVLLLDYKNHKDAHKRGVYKLNFGKKFYIGRSKLIKQRIVAHENDLNKILSKGETLPEGHYYYKVINHIRECHIGMGLVEILEYGTTVEELVAMEQKWLDKYKKNKNCLNIGFVAAKSYNAIEETLSKSIKRVYKNNYFTR